MTRQPRFRTASLAVAALFLLTARAAAGQGGRRRPRNPPNAAESGRQPKLTPRRVSLDGGRSFDLNLPEGFDIKVAAQGLRRVRFMAESQDGRIFVTDMHDLSDNKKGVVYILDEFDP